MVFMKLAACATAAVIGGGGVAADTCTCPPPEVETISCLNGVPSWAPATCNLSKVDLSSQGGGVYAREVLLCPQPETAISGGYYPDIYTGTPSPMLVMKPAYIGSTHGGHATGYRFVWSVAGNASPEKIYITCARV